MKKKNTDIKWNVWIWDFNHDSLEAYDVMPRFVSEYNRLKPKDRPDTLEDTSKWLKSEARYNFWAKCEYEMIIHGWPEQKNDSKVDVYDQLKMNWDVFVEYFYNNIVK